MKTNLDIIMGNVHPHFNFDFLIEIYVMFSDKLKLLILEHSVTVTYNCFPPVIKKITI